MHIVSDRPIPTRWRLCAGLWRSRSSGDCAGGCLAPLPEGVRAVCCHSAQPRSATPDLRGRAILATRVRTETFTRPRPGHRCPCGAWLRHDPHVRRSSLTRPSIGQDGGSMGEVWRAGITSRLDQSSTHSSSGGLSHTTFARLRVSRALRATPDEFVARELTLRVDNWGALRA